MRSLKVSQLHKIFCHVADTVIENEPYLTQIDTIIGDGDHGTGMKRGFTALKNMLEKSHFSDVKSLCSAVGMELLKSMGGASGVIFCTMFMGGVKGLPEGDIVNLRELATYFMDGEAAVERRGKARLGEKTMRDAFYPAVLALKEAAEKDVDMETAFQMAFESAVNGAKASEAMKPRVGRSKNFHEAAVGYPDPGAVSTSLIFRAFWEAIVFCEEGSGKT